MSVLEIGVLEVIGCGNRNHIDVLDSRVWSEIAGSRLEIWS